MTQAAALEFYVSEEGSQYNKHDAGYSSLLYSKRAFVELLRSFVGRDWVEKLDENSIIRVDKKYVLPDFAEKEADIVYKGQIDGEQVIFYILVELQSTVDYLMPYRLLLYTIEIWRDVFRDTPKNVRERKGFRFPAIVPIVLYNGKYNWTARRHFRDIVNQGVLFGNCIPDFEYFLIDVNRYDEKELLKSANLISSVFYIDQKRDTDEIYKRLEDLISTLKGLDYDQFNLFKNWMKRVICKGLPEGMEKEISEILDKDSEVDLMIANLTQTLREERKRERLEGKIEGITEGKVEGRVEERIEVVIKLLTKRFGQLSEDLATRVHAADEVQLGAIIDDIFQIQSLEEASEYLK